MQKQARMPSMRVILSTLTIWTIEKQSNRRVTKWWEHKSVTLYPALTYISKERKYLHYRYLNETAIYLERFKDYAWDSLGFPKNTRFSFPRESFRGMKVLKIPSEFTVTYFKKRAPVGTRWEHIHTFTLLCVFSPLNLLLWFSILAMH